MSTVKMEIAVPVEVTADIIRKADAVSSALDELGVSLNALDAWLEEWRKGPGAHEGERLGAQVVRIEAIFAAAEACWASSHPDDELARSIFSTYARRAVQSLYVGAVLDGADEDAGDGEEA